MIEEHILNLHDTAGGDGVKSWKKSCLRFVDELPSLAYAYGLYWKDIVEQFPEIYSIEGHYNLLRGGSWPSWEKFVKKDFDGIDPLVVKEITNKELWDWDYMFSDQCDWFGQQEDHNYKIKNQCDWILEKKTRIPRKVLDVAGGRGSLAHALKYCGADVVSFDSGNYCQELFDITSKIFFNNTINVTPIIESIENICDHINIQEFDTIIFCEAIEHFTEKQIDSLWTKICTEFNGRVIICNHMNYHPIPIHMPEHVREINDQVYDRFVAQSKQCIFRSGSHLVLEFRSK